ncbi:MAG: hypothetical protein LH618_04910 [Saprospiraceae bacterium]|nr:hypothetical protein [Saprospiraceae bacterium]
MKHFLLWMLPFVQPALHAQTISWATDVAPILYDHCVTCHRAGGVGSFPLETWTDAQLNAASMLQAVQTRRMPGNDAIIHHIVLYTDPTNTPLLLDQADPGPGFKTNGMVGNITPQAETL